MSFASLEREVIAELRRIVNNNRLPLRRLLEWSTSESVVRKNAREGEELYWHRPHVSEDEHLVAFPGGSYTLYHTSDITIIE